MRFQTGPQYQSLANSVLRIRANSWLMFWATYSLRMFQQKIRTPMVRIVGRIAANPVKKARLYLSPIVLSFLAPNSLSAMPPSF